MKLNQSHWMNELVLVHLDNPKGLRFNPEPLTLPNEHKDPYTEAGSHPDIVGRVWNDLGDSLPVDCRAIIYGSPALVQPDTGIVIALAYGTRYIIRILAESIEEALKVGCHTEQEWTVGGKTNIEKEMGRGWLFGSWAKEENQWLLNMYQTLYKE